MHYWDSVAAMWERDNFGDERVTKTALQAFARRG